MQERSQRAAEEGGDGPRRVLRVRRLARHPLSEAATSRCVLVPSTELIALVRECFRGMGLSKDDAEAVSAAIVDANLRGFESHGFERVPVYLRRLKAGLAGGTDRMSVVARSGALLRLDAGSGLGPAVAVKAMDLAIELAGEDGVGVVAVGNSTNFGAAGFYARRAARRELVGIVTTNSPKAMAPHGAAEPFLGTNPIAIAIPLGDGNDELVLDMATSAVARGKIRRAHALGEPIEPGVAIDAHGHPTDDPDAALGGSLLPLGGPKGSGLAFAIAVLVGILTGADFDDELPSMYSDFDRPSNPGHVFIVIDPWRLADYETTMRRLRGLVDRLHSLRTRPGFASVLYAGEKGSALARERESAGVPIAISELEHVASACRECGLHAFADRFEELPLIRAQKEAESWAW